MTDVFDVYAIDGVVLRRCLTAGVLGIALGSNLFGAALLGVETLPGDLPLFDSASGRVRNERPGDAPPRFLLSRARYWTEDGHLDLLVRLTPEEFEAAPAALRASIHDDDGRELSAFEVSPLPGRQCIVYPALPSGLAGGGAGEIRLALVRQDDGAVIAGDQHAFRVERHPGAASVAGRVVLRLPNEKRLHARGVPVSVGVPFPRTFGKLIVE